MIFRGGMNSACDIGYGGPLCQSCMIFNGTRYSKKGGTQCVECFSNKIEIVITFFIMLAYIAFYLILVKFKLIFSATLIILILRGSISFESNESDAVKIKELSSTYLKIFTSYIQMIMMISNLQLNWGSAIQNLYSAQNTLSGNIFKIVSLDCLLGSI